MKFVVLGATGGIGLEIVRQAIERGHSVTAFVPNPAAMNGFRDRIAILQGNLLNRADMEHAISSHDAILSGFGPRVPISKADKTLLRDFATTLTGAMGRTGVKLRSTSGGQLPLIVRRSSDAGRAASDRASA